MLSLPDAVVTMKGLIGNVGCTLRTDMEGDIQEAVGIYGIAGTMTLFGLTDGVNAVEEDAET